MNIREKRKKDRINSIKRMMENAEKENIEMDIEDLASTMVVNHGISRSLALEEINAIKKFLGK